MRTLACALLLAACSEKPPTSTTSEPLPTSESGNFTLYVSNQSFDLDPVDIAIAIDDRSAVEDDFYVGNQHSWREFRFALAGGGHLLSVRSEIADVELVETFEITGNHWAVVDFWYYPDSGPEPTPQQFSFLISDEPLYFD